MYLCILSLVSLLHTSVVITNTKETHLLLSLAIWVQSHSLTSRCFLKSCFTSEGKHMLSVRDTSALTLSQGIRNSACPKPYGTDRQSNSHTHKSSLHWIHAWFQHEQRQFQGWGSSTMSIPVSKLCLPRFCLLATDKGWGVEGKRPAEEGKVQMGRGLLSQ